VTIRWTTAWLAASGLILASFVARSSNTASGRPDDAKKAQPARVLIIRHAEKPPDQANSIHLAPEGKKRAEALYQLFEASAKRPDPFPKPDFIFAARNSSQSERSVETVTPLPEKLKLSVNAAYHNDDFARLARDLRRDPKYAGKTILICWHHGTAPLLARALKAADAPTAWRGSAFDRVWQIDYDATGKATFRDRPQQLLAGDSAK